MRVSFTGSVHFCVAAVVGLAISPLSTAAQSDQAQGGWKADVRIGVSVTSANFTDVRSTIHEANIKDRGNLQALEINLGPRGGGFGLVGRYQQAGLGAERFMLRDGGLYLGGRSFRIEAAYAERELPGEDSTTVLARAGIRSSMPVGYGLWIFVAGSGYGRFERVEGEDLLNAWEGESHLAFTVPRFPVYVQAGYRMARYELGAVAGPREYKGVTIGAGIWTNGR